MGRWVTFSDNGARDMESGPQDAGKNGKYKGVEFVEIYYTVYPTYDGFFFKRVPVGFVEISAIFAVHYGFLFERKTVKTDFCCRC